MSGVFLSVSCLVSFMLLHDSVVHAYHCDVSHLNSYHLSILLLMDIGIVSYLGLFTNTVAVNIHEHVPCCERVHISVGCIPGM